MSRLSLLEFRCFLQWLLCFLRVMLALTALLPSYHILQLARYIWILVQLLAIRLSYILFLELLSKLLQFLLLRVLHQHRSWYLLLWRILLHFSVARLRRVKHLTRLGFANAQFRLSRNIAHTHEWELALLAAVEDWVVRHIVDLWVKTLVGEAVRPRYTPLMR